MYPMDYEEFEWALGKGENFPLMRQLFESRKSFGDAITRDLLRKFRLYMLVGGMPQAVETYLDTNNLGEVDAKNAKS